MILCNYLDATSSEENQKEEMIDETATTAIFEPTASSSGKTKANLKSESSPAPLPAMKSEKSLQSAVEEIITETVNKGVSLYEDYKQKLEEEREKTEDYKQKLEEEREKTEDVKRKLEETENELQEQRKKAKIDAEYYNEKSKEYQEIIDKVKKKGDFFTNIPTCVDCVALFDKEQKKFYDHFKSVHLKM